MKRLFPIFIILTLLLCISTVSASENNTNTDTTQKVVDNTVNSNTYTTIEDIKTQSSESKYSKTAKDATKQVKTVEDTKTLKTQETHKIQSISSNKTLKTANVKYSKIYVSTTGKDSNAGTQNAPKATIKNALKSVTNKGTIYLNKGTYYENKIYINKTVAIVGSDTKGTILNGKGSHVFTIASNIKVKFEKFTITNASDKQGGAIYNKGYLKLQTMKISNSRATYGGAIYNKNELIGIKTSFSSNKATHGGAIYNTDSASMVNCTYNKNQATNIGGVIYSTGKITLQGNNLTQNYGSAIYLAKNKQNNKITNTQFISNNGVLGGAIYNDGQINIKKSTFQSNKATKNGGAIYNKNIYNSRNSKYIQNTAKINGGAIYTTNNIYINSNTFTSNNATGNGGAIYNTATLNAKSTTLQSNRAQKGGAIYSANGKVNINNSILLNNNNVDIYAFKGSTTANYNWWGTNSMPSSQRKVNVVTKNWIYFKISSPSSKYINEVCEITTTFNKVYNGKTLTDYNTKLLPALPVKLTVNGGGINKIYNYNVAGTKKISLKFTKEGVVNFKTYTPNITVNAATTIKSKITEGPVTGVFLKMNTDIDTNTVKKWVNAGVTDVYVQAKASTNDVVQLKKVISLCKNTNIRVHAWVICFKTSNGFNIGSSQQTLIKNFVAKVVKIPGVDGVCLDYARYSGTNPSIVNPNIVTNFVKQINNIVKSHNKQQKVSMCVFAEKSGSKTYYGQDYAALSPYVDVMMPMAYRYDYNAGQNWLKSVTNYVVKEAKYSKVVTILQTYIEKGGSYPKLPVSSLKSDAKVAMSGGSYGYALFREGLISSFPPAAKNL